MAKIFELLEAKTSDKNYHLKSLNQIHEIDLNIYKEVIDLISLNEIRDMLNATNWREHLIAYMLILTGNIEELLPEIKSRIEKGSFVSSQLVCAVAMLGGRRSGDTLLSLINSGSLDSKAYGSILAALPYCFINNIDINYYNIDLSGLKLGLDVANTHLEFWNNERKQP